MHVNPSQETSGTQERTEYLSMHITYDIYSNTGPQTLPKTTGDD